MEKFKEMLEDSIMLEGSLADVPVSWLKQKYRQLSAKTNRNPTEDNVLRQVRDALTANDVDVKSL